MQDPEADAFQDVVQSIVGLGMGFLLDEVDSAWTSRVSPDASAYAQTTQLDARLHAAVRELPDRLRELVEFHYFQHRPFQELAADWGITKGRVSQLHRAALDRLARALAP